ncbi:hypothetical protein [Nonomuraea recticatena]|uniref:hypothetical protein n=1 Tax=Nonomuraea recticatena TaxID=46178 RepID=UPI0036168BDD
MKSANLGWGQRYMWLRFHQLPPRHQRETHVVLRFDLPSGLTVAACRAMLTYLVRRHEILRTTFDLGPEPAQRCIRPRRYRSRWPRPSGTAPPRPPTWSRSSPAGRSTSPPSGRSGPA